MSKLIDKLNRIYTTMSQPIGFTTSRSLSEKPRMLLIASSSFPPIEKVNSPADYSGSADAWLLHITKSNLTASIAQEITRFLPEVPWGVRLRNIGKTEIAAAYKAGSDFVVFPATSKVTAIPQDDKLGRILQVESSLSDDSLKAVGELQVDAVLLTDGNDAESSLTWHYLMLLQHFTSLLTKPLLVSVPLNVTADELQILWNTGAGGVVFEVSDSRHIKRLEKVRQYIDNLTPPQLRKPGKAEARLPYVGGDSSAMTDIDDEDE